jgi:hypothetical protein
MMGYQSCIDWCHKHPAILTILLTLFIILPLFLYAVTRIYDGNRSYEPCPDSSGLPCLASDLERQQPPNHSRGPRKLGPAWTRVLTILRLSSPDYNHNDFDSDEDFEPQEKTPLIGSTPGDLGWRKKGQLSNNWHGTNQLNTSWSYMA